jgi:hypothetical protein
VLQVLRERITDSGGITAARRVPSGYLQSDWEFATNSRRTDHAVTQVWLDLEDAPAQMVNIRYEFRPQLVRLSILPPAPTADPLQRRERARGFEPGFCPEPTRQR